MKKLLVVVDFQNDFVDGALGFPKASLLEEIISEKISDYRKNNHEVVFTFDTHAENYLETLEGKNLPVVHCVKDSDGWQLYGKVKDAMSEADKTFIKYTFGSDKLFDYLRENDFDEIELVGLVSNICVLSNAVLAKAAKPEANIIVDSKATASFDEDLNAKTFDILRGIQVTVL